VKIEHIENTQNIHLNPSSYGLKKQNIINNTISHSNEQINKIDNHNISQIISDEALLNITLEIHTKEENHRGTTIKILVIPKNCCWSK
jgi:hypothetical protein